MLTFAFNDSILKLSPEHRAQWDILAGPHALVGSRFLGALEQSKAVSPQTGWQAHHLLGFNDAALVVAVPLYGKSHSMGEFVFDFAFARAYEQHGLAYYPKLLTMVPFTPATQPHLLIDASLPREQVCPQILSILKQSVARSDATSTFSSLHANFLTESERDIFVKAGFADRIDCQYHWHNADYRDFDDYLDTFKSEKRKKAKRERRRVLEMGIELRWQRADELSEAEWSRIFALKRQHFLRHGHEPYLSLEFFLLVRAAQPELLWVNVARLNDEIIAMAICFNSNNTLYGRYWGAMDDIHSLHFEVCYHQGIEFCIQNRLMRFEPGTQGQHKIARGFVPTLTHSAHWFNHAGFRGAAEDYFSQEQAQVREYAALIESHQPFKQQRPDEYQAAAASNTLPLR